MSKKPKKNPFDPDYAPYGHYKGERGNPSQWKAAFENRFTPDESEKILGEDTVQSKGEWAILGILVDSSWDDVKRAYRKLALTHHPDVGGDPEQFKKIHAAYSLIASKFGAKA